MRNIYRDTRILDRRACESFGLTEDILMENAAAALERAVTDVLSDTARISAAVCGAKASPVSDAVTVLIVTGGGDNGADGYALARRIAKSISCVVYEARPPASPACVRQKERALACGVCLAERLVPCAVLVDCLAGSGFRLPARDDFIALVRQMNAAECIKIACDIPSSLDGAGQTSNGGEGENGVQGEAFRADVTVCMGALKTALFSDEAKDCAGIIRVADLGVSRTLFETGDGTGEPEMKLAELSDLRLPVRREQNVHKGTFGHCAVLAGEKRGAGVLSALAASAFGSGLVTLVTERDRVENCPWELMQSRDFPANTTAVCAGMGMGETSRQTVEYIISHPGVPCVLDADMLRSPDVLTILETRGTGVVLTPHPAEFACLLGICGLGTYSTREAVADRAELVKRFCAAFPGTVLLLKGANTLVTCGAITYVHTLGTSALAKGGSGDVLSGLIGALLAQGYTPLEAALHGSLAHAAAAGQASSSYGLSPLELIEAARRLESSL